LTPRIQGDHELWFTVFSAGSGVLRLRHSHPPDRKRPRFCRGSPQLLGWLVGLLYNACGDFAAELDPAWEDSFIRTLRRTFLNRPGKLSCTPTSLIVYFDRKFAYQGDVLPVIDRINAEPPRIPWLNNRLLVLSIGPDANPRARS